MYGGAIVDHAPPTAFRGNPQSSLTAFLLLGHLPLFLVPTIHLLSYPLNLGSLHADQCNNDPIQNLPLVIVLYHGFLALILETPPAMLIYLHNIGLYPA
jgi:hypothetical protein